MNLFFIRHGQSETNAAGQLGGQLDTPLTEKGISQARAAIEGVRAINPDVIYCSPLMRAHTTAIIIAEALGMSDELVVDARLKERGAGVLEGTDDKGGKQLVSCAPDDIEGVETLAQIRQRAKSFIDDIEQRHPDQTVLIVGHGAHIKTMLYLREKHNWNDLCRRVLPNGVPFKSIDEVA